MVRVPPTAGNRLAIFISMNHGYPRFRRRRMWLEYLMCLVRTPCDTHLFLVLQAAVKLMHHAFSKQNRWKNYLLTLHIGVIW